MGMNVLTTIFRVSLCHSALSVVSCFEFYFNPIANEIDISREGFW